MKTTKDYNNDGNFLHHSMHSYDHKIDERVELILNTSPDKFKNNNNSFISNISKNEMNYNNMIFFGPSVWETSKFFIIVTSKGGSTITESILLDNNLSLKKMDDNLMKSYKYFVNIENKYTENDVDNEFLEYLKALNGKSKKDIIIFTRNPIIKWMSGVIMDIELLLNNSPIIKKLIDVPHCDDKDEYNLNLLRSFLPKYLNELWETRSSFLDGHSHLYNEHFFQLLTLNKGINLNKLHIVDIDNPNHDIVEVVRNYYPEIKETHSTQHFWTKRDKHEYIFNDLESYLKANNFSQPLINLLEKQISNEYKWYKILLKTYENNLWKKKSN